MKQARGGFRILPVLMVFAALCFGVRFSELIKNIVAAGSISAYAATSNDHIFNDIETAAGEAPPQSELKGAGDAPETPAAQDGGTITPGAKPAEAAKADVPAKPDVEAPSLGAPPEKGWKGAEDVDDNYSDVKMEMFSDLTKRRKDMDAREKDLAMREALLKAAQSELQQKTDELNNIKADIQTLLKQQTDQENERVASLVKIYEGMKAKDAARIFNTLDMDVLLQVMTKMSERKTAPVLAAMDPDRARNVTTMMAEQNKLPDLPVLPTGQ